VATAYTGGFWPVGGSILVSTNSFASWNVVSAPSLNYSSAVALAADGNNLIAVADNGVILTSTNSGMTYSQSSAPNYRWSSVASSADGNKLVAVSGNGPIYTSIDSGNTWQSNAAPVTNWISVVSSTDGCKLVAAVSGGGIYTWQTTPTPVLNITPSGGNLLISWTVPSLNFWLQQNTNLNTTNWVDVPIAPTLNTSNLQNQVTLPATSGMIFYRLAAQLPD